MGTFTDEQAISALQKEFDIKFSDEQLQILRHRGGIQIVACAGSGKALVNGTGVLTTKGYKNIEDLKIGDEVFDENGRVQRVTGVYPQGVCEVYEVTVNGVHTIKCNGSHLWKYKNSEGWKVGTTIEMLEDKNKLGDSFEMELPSNKPVVFSNEVVKGLNGYDLVSFLMYTESRTASIYDMYKYGDVQKRLEIMQGALNASNNLGDGLYSVAFDSKALANDIEFIAETLGLNASVREGFLKPYEVVIETGINKDELSYDKVVEGNLVRKIITDIKKTSETAEMTCIKVSGESELFLTEHCTVTHNTTLITYLVAKRIMTGEISDPSKLLMTTYSKAGAEEMSNRINNILAAMGDSDKVEVKTMHAMYYKCLARFGLISKICTNAQRKQFIRQSVKDIKLRLEDQDIDELDSLLSYQINNMMSDEELYNSYVFTLDIRLEDYSNIRTGYAKKKQEAGVIDFDDLQYYVYYYLCIVKHPDFVKYCKSQWKYFYVDEFQDTSKIQFKILQALVTDGEQLMVIGDDDQCFLPDTPIMMADGSKKEIVDIRVGDMVATCLGHGEVGASKVESTSKKYFYGKIYRVETASGAHLDVTGNHVVFTKERDVQRNKTSIKVPDKFVMFGGQYKEDFYSSKLFKAAENMSSLTDEFENMNSDRLLDMCGEKADRYIEILKYGDRLAKFTKVEDLREGDILYRVDNGRIEEDRITKVLENGYHGFVYDINVAGTRNYIAHNLAVHNCIYSWRGADPSIILNIGAYYNLKKFYLSTNYRCRQEILDFAATGVKNMYSRENKDMKAFKPYGKVELMDAKMSDLYDMSVKVMEYIKEEIANGVAPGDIAVLVRNNSHASVLSNMLMLNGIYTKYPEDMKLTKFGLFKDLELLIEMAGDEYNPQSYDKELPGKILWRMVPYLGLAGSSILYEMMDNKGLGLTDALGVLVRDFLMCGGQQCKVQVNFDKAVVYKIDMRCRRFGYETRMKLSNIYNILSMDDRDKKVSLLINEYMQGNGFLLGDDNDTQRVFKAFFKHFQTLISERGLKEVEKLIAMTKQYESGNVEILGDKVTLTTVHSSKGMEWGHVIIMAYDSLGFPSLPNILDLVDKNVAVSDIADYIDGERRLNYVALTRAINKLTLVGDSKNFSLFGLEALDILNDASAQDFISIANRQQATKTLKIDLGDPEVWSNVKFVPDFKTIKIPASKSS